MTNNTKLTREDQRLITADVEYNKLFFLFYTIRDRMFFYKYYARLYIVCQNIDFNYNEKEMCFFKTKNYIVGQPFSAKTNFLINYPQNLKINMILLFGHKDYRYVKCYFQKKNIRNSKTVT